MTLFPPPAFHYMQEAIIRLDSNNFMRGNRIVVTSLGNRKYLFFGPYWYFVRNIETGRRYVAREDELVPTNQMESNT